MDLENSGENTNLMQGTVDSLAATTTTTTTTATDPESGLPVVDDLRRHGNLWCWGTTNQDVANGYDVTLDYASV